jgi:hypothetical protein
MILMATSFGECQLVIFSLPAYFFLMYESRFLYDKKDASFMNLPFPAYSNLALDPPHNCSVCARREEEEIQSHGRILRAAGAITGVAIYGSTFHVGDFVFLRAEQGPARIVQLIGLYSGDPVWVKVQLLGRVSDLVDLLPADEFRDEVLLSLFLYRLALSFRLLAPPVLHG